MPGYYDVVLGLIPLSLAGLTAALVAGGLPSAVAVPLASTVSAGVIGHAMFVNGPDAETPETAPAAE